MKEYESIQTLLDPVRNFGKVTVSIGYTNLDTVIVLSTGDGTRLPYPITDGPFNLIWYNWSEYRDPADDPNREIVRVTARTGDIITVGRHEEGTTATNKNLIGRIYKMILSQTKKTIDDIAANFLTTISDLTGSRSSATVYQNIRSSSMWVFVTNLNNPSNGPRFLSKIGSTNPPTLEIADTYSTGNSNRQSFNFVVPANWYYSITITDNALGAMKWYEGT